MSKALYPSFNSWPYSVKLNCNVMSFGKAIKLVNNIEKCIGPATIGPDGKKAWGLFSTDDGTLFVTHNESLCTFVVLSEVTQGLEEDGQ